MNKKAMQVKFSTILIGLIIFSMIVTAFSEFYGSIGKEYNVEIDNSINSTYNKVDYANNLSISLGNELQNNPSDFSTFVLGAKTVLSVPKLIFGSLGVFHNLIQGNKSLGTDFGLPPYIVTGIIAMFTIMIVFLAIGLWSRYSA